VQAHGNEIEIDLARRAREEKLELAGEDLAGYDFEAHKDSFQLITTGFQLLVSLGEAINPILLSVNDGDDNQPPVR